MQHLETWRTFMKTEKGRQPRTVQEYTNDLAQFAQFMDKSQPAWNWSEVSTLSIRSFLAALERKKGTATFTPSPHRVHRLVSALRSYMGFLANEGLINGNPAAKINKPKLPQRLPKSMTPLEVSKMLEAVTKHCRSAEKTRNWCLIAFLYGSGLRISECLGLTLEEGKSIVRQDGLPVAVRVIGKGNKERIVPLSSTAQTALHQWIRHRKLEGDITNPYVWVNTRGRSKNKPLSIQAADKIIRTAALEAGLGSRSAHKLRHSFASALVEAGRSLDEVKDILGHESIATTQIYVKASQARLQTAVLALPDITGMVSRG